ncbi:MAG: site-specific integrase [Enterobacterales bacterium]|nr:site-specific integrase [Enterobacterales bacterium]
MKILNRNYGTIRRGFIDQPIHELTTRDIELFVVGRKKEKRAMQTIKHSIIQLRSMIEYVGKMGYNIPEITYPVLKVENSRIRSLSKDEEVRLFKELEPTNPKYYKQLTPKTEKTYLLDQRQDNFDLVTLLIDLGCRYSEASEMKSEQVNLRDKTINLKRTKTNNESILMMSDRVFNVLKRRYETKKNDTWVFTDKTGLKPRRHSTIAIRNALKNAGVSDFKVHDFRHTFASRMVRNGMTLQETAQLLGHSNISTTMRYAHLENQQVALKMKQLINDFNSDTDGETNE